MTRSPTPGGGDPSGRSSQTFSVTVSRTHLLLGLVVVTQSVWLGLVLGRGWYSSADLPNLAFANGRDLDWDYLTSTLGGHFGVAPRLMYWLLNRAAPLEWWPTVLIRLACQAGATVLLWRLMRTLAGPRPWVWVALVGYAFSPYLVPGMAALNSGLGLSISQVCLLGALLAHVRYARHGRLLDAVVVAVLVLLMLAFAQQSVLMLVFIPALSFVFLPQGSWRERLRAGLSLWRGWLILGGALGLFALLYLAGDYNSPSSDFAPRYGLWLAGQAWLAILGPALLGGPWQFDAYPNQWSGYANPPALLVILGQVLLVGLVVVAVRRRGLLGVIALSLPVLTTVATLLLVGASRSWLGEVLPSILRYSFFVPVSLALGIVLAFGPRTRSTDGTGDRPTPSARSGRRGRALVATGITVLVASSVYSTARFADRFWENPADEFVASVLDDAAARGPSVQLFDTVLPESVAPYISQMYLSDLMALGGLSADYDKPSNGRLVVDDDGRLVPARFVDVADIVGPRRDGCGIFVRGEGTTRVRLGWVSRTQDWFLQLELYQPRANQVTMKVFDQSGDELDVVSGSSTLRMSDSLVVLHRRLEAGRPAVIELTSTDPDTNLCLVHAYVGVPLP